MNKKGFTLIELLAVIVILAIVTVIGVTTILPYMQNARRDAFNVEATEVVKAAREAVSLDGLGKITFTTDKSYHSGSEYCFTVEELANLGIYDGNTSAYSGKVLVNTSTNAYTFTLNLKKNDEFKIIGGTREDYTGFTAFSTATWTASTHAKC